MICESASEAEAMLAMTMDSRHNFGQLSFLYAALNSIYTFRCWTPFEVILVVNVGSSQKYFVSVAMSAMFSMKSLKCSPILNLIVHK